MRTDDDVEESSDGNEQQPRYPTPTLEPPEPLNWSQTLMTQDQEPFPHEHQNDNHVEPGVSHWGQEPKYPLGTW